MDHRQQTDYRAQAQASVIGAPAPSADTILAKHIRALEETAQQSAMIADRLERILARAFGENVGAEVSNKPPLPAGAINLMEDKMSFIGQSLAAASSLIDRLATLV